MIALWQDIRYGFRLLKSRPGFALTVVLCLALGIGANTAIFSVIHGVLLKPLPFRDADRLCMVWETFRANQRGSVSYLNFEDWKARNRVFASQGGFFPVNHTLTELGAPERILGGRVTADFFPTLGVRPVLGRTFTPDEALVGAENVAVVTYGFWQRRFAGNPTLIGQTLTIDQVPFTVVGILPAQFSFGVGLEKAEIWTPTALDSVCFEERGWPRLRIVGRLRPEATLAQGQTQMNETQQWLEKQYPETSEEHGIRVVPLHTEMVGHVRHLLLLLLGAVGLVLLTACANVANLLLARSTIRTKELAIRAAVGAGRLRLIRQLLTESMVFGLLGGLAGTLLAYSVLDALVALIPAGLPRAENIRIDTGVLLFTVAISVATSLIFGLAPALHASGMSRNAALKEGGQSSSCAGRKHIRSVLVAAQVALSLMLLIGAGLLMRSLHRLVMVDPGFNTQNLLTFQIHLGWDHPSDSVTRENLYQRIVGRVAALPGVESAGAASSLPMRRAEGFPFTIKGRPEPPERERPGALYRSITEDYFATMGISLIRGRCFTAQDTRDDRPGALIINQAMARRFWPGEDPIGQIVNSVINIDDVDPKEYHIVGVVGDVHALGLHATAEACMYAPYRQQTFPYMGFVVRCSHDPISLVGPIRKEVAAVTRKEAAFQFRTFDEIIAGSTQGRRFPTVLLGIFASVALVLAGVGIYSMLCFVVVHRTREIGVRMSLGAHGPDVLRMMLRQGMRIVGAGLAAGLIASLATSHLLSQLLFETSVLDPVTFFSVSVLLTLVAFVACYLPARRAARIDPMEALRYE